MRNFAAVSLVAHASAQTWEEYKFLFGKVYNGDDAETRHQSTFRSNMAIIDDQNSLGSSLKFGANQFTDLTQDEFRVAAGLGYIAPAENLGTSPALGEHVHQEGEFLAGSVDWTHRGAVTPVKNQGTCGSCWTFSATGALEGAWKLAGGPLKSMSEQQHVDCDKEAGNNGCKGGNMQSVFSWLESRNTCDEKYYPYTGVEGACHARCGLAIPKGSVLGYKNVQRGSVNSLKSAVNQHPVSISIEADQTSFQHYRSGVIDSGCGQTLDHGVLVVGYGVLNGDPYWKIKNSWGASAWGTGGYGLISMNNNQCGVLSGPVYPVVRVSSSLLV